MTDVSLLTLGCVARLHNVADWQLRRAIRRGFLLEPPRVGQYRVFARDDMPRVAAALLSAGYLPADPAPAVC